MRYVHDKPEPVYEPKKWERPKPEKTKPNQSQLSLFNEPKSDNKVEIEKLNKQIDYLEDEWDKLWNEDPEKNKIDLEELDGTIQSLVKKRDGLEFCSSYPF